MMLVKPILQHYQRRKALVVVTQQIRTVYTPSEYFSPQQMQAQVDEENERIYVNSDRIPIRDKLRAPNIGEDFNMPETGDAILDRVFSAGKEAMRTRKVQVIQPTKRRHKKLVKTDEPKYRTTRITTFGTLPMPTDEARDLSMSETRINVLPLLVLDLNGILCHRVRRQLKFADDQLNMMYPFRPKLGPNIALTPIIPRPDVSTFLEYLDEHFCLAIWTSARTKTANALISLLIPEPVRDRLLFVWSQTQCEASLQAPDSSIPSDVIYRKNLSLVWKKFPLWNVHNTVLMDDSEQKCIHYKANAIHPPSLNGRQVQQQPNENSNETFTHPKIQMSDEVNVTKQLEFMQQFVLYWTTATVVQTWDSRNDDGIPVTVHDDTNDLTSFLTRHATGHMGYQLPT